MVASRSLSTSQAFAAVLAFLERYGEPFEDQEGVTNLLAWIRSASQPPSGLETVEVEWLRAIALAFAEPEIHRTKDGYDPATPIPDVTGSSGRELNPVHALDAMIRLLERAEPQFPAANYFLMSVWYSDLYTYEVNTIDPYAWWDWLAVIDAVITPSPDTNG